MPDKKREQWHVELLRKVLPDFPVGSIESNRERPDFIVHAETKKIGIEVTTFHLPKVAGQRPHSEVQSLKRRVVDLARQKHEEAGGPALYVSVHFQHEPFVTKANTRAVAEGLLRALWTTALPTSINVGHISIEWPHLPEGIASINVLASVDGKDGLWYASACGWVVPLQPAQIEHVIESKQKKMLAAARTECTEVWLVIVNDMSQTEPVELTDTVARSVVTQSFDRVLWFEPHQQKVWALGTPEVFRANTHQGDQPAAQ